MQDNFFLKPKRSLGQNFLIDKNIAKKIVDSLQIQENDIVIEIGPGSGALTDFIIKKNIIYYAIELDKNAVNLLNLKYPKESFPNFNLLNGDVRDFKISSLSNYKKVKVIGNIPYNISSEIFFWIFEQAEFVNNSILMIQKEVAQRLAARQKTKDYGILTIALQLVGESKILFDVPPTCFIPKPKVTSSVIEFTFSDNLLPNDKFLNVMKLVRASFNQRRKVLRNSLSKYFLDNSFLKIDEFIKFVEQTDIKYFKLRAEELTKDDFIILFDLINSKKNEI